jgi:hypothetical protein
MKGRHFHQEAMQGTELIGCFSQMRAEHMEKD